VKDALMMTPLPPAKFVRYSTNPNSTYIRHN
jgi:hypothetical protein